MRIGERATLIYVALATFPPKSEGRIGISSRYTTHRKKKTTKNDSVCQSLLTYHEDLIQPKSMHPRICNATETTRPCPAYGGDCACGSSNQMIFVSVRINRLTRSVHLVKIFASTHTQDGGFIPSQCEFAWLIT
jgi:hypothetical protein